MGDAFDEARRDRAILFLDEADTFFINRESAHRSWEVSQTNELLTQMEKHRGILICCTNLLVTLDKAAMRRAIPNLTPGDIKAVWQKLRFIPETDRKHDEIISALEAEVKYREEASAKRIGSNCRG
ncbi:MAG: AAA family ATPase [Pseudomonadota bacterium]